MKLVAYGAPFTFATLGATGRVELFPSFRSFEHGRTRALLDDRGCVWWQGSLGAELLPDGEIRVLGCGGFEIDGHLRPVGGGFVLRPDPPQRERVTRTGIVMVDDRPWLRFEGYRPGLECAAALLMALVDASMPSMACVDGVKPDPIPPPVGSRCRSRGPD